MLRPPDLVRVPRSMHQRRTRGRVRHEYGNMTTHGGWTARCSRRGDPRTWRGPPRDVGTGRLWLRVLQSRRPVPQPCSWGARTIRRPIGRRGTRLRV